MEETQQDRIRNRQQRLEAKKQSSALRKGDAARADGAAAAGAGGSALKVPVKALARVADGMTVLDAKKSHTIEDVTAVRLSADVREQERRLAEDERIQDRLHKLREEAAASGRANAAVQLKWADILERNLPQELAAELATQREACAAILASKDSLLDQLSREVKLKDDGYVKSLQDQRVDIETLVGRMTSQFKELSGSYEAELAAMEAAFVQERDELLAANRREIDGLFEARRSMETRFVTEKLAREETYARELTDMQAADAENYQKLKVKLETDVAVLEQQLEAMKFTYLLNTEKLEYNFRVLTERDSENKQTLAAQKQRLARLRSALSKVQSEYETTDAKFKARNAALTGEYGRTTRQFRELQAKFRHFEAADAVRYGEISGMHEAEMGAMAARLTSADRVITEQLLGWAWEPPPQPAAAAAAAAASGVAAGEGTEAVAPATFGDVQSAAAKLLLLGGTADSAATADADDAAGSADATAGGSTLAAAAPVVAARPACVRALLRLLLHHCGGFLVPQKVAASAALAVARAAHAHAAEGDGAGGEEEAGGDDAGSGARAVADAVQADALLRAIGCDTPADVDSLAAAFQRGIAAAAAQAAGEAAEGAVTAALARLRGEDGEGTDGGSAVGSGAYGLDVLEGGGEQGADASGGGRGRDRQRTGGGGSSGVSPPHQQPRTALPHVPAAFSVVRCMRAWVDEHKRSKRDAAAAAASAAAAGGGDASAGAGAGDRDARLGAALGKLDAALQGAEGAAAAPAAAVAVAAASRSRVDSLAEAAADDGLPPSLRGLADALPPHKLRIWRALAAGLGRYKAVLASRHKLAAGCEALEAENAQLRQAVAHYLQPGYGGLQVPPAHTVAVAHLPVPLPLLQQQLPPPSPAATAAGSAWAASGGFAWGTPGRAARAAAGGSALGAPGEAARAATSGSAWAAPGEAARAATSGSAWAAPGGAAPYGVGPAALAVAARRQQQQQGLAASSGAGLGGGVAGVGVAAASSAAAAQQHRQRGLFRQLPVAAAVAAGGGFGGVLPSTPSSRAPSLQHDVRSGGGGAALGGPAGGGARHRNMHAAAAPGGGGPGGHSSGSGGALAASQPSLPGSLRASAGKGLSSIHRPGSGPGRHAGSSSEEPARGTSPGGRAAFDAAVDAFVHPLDQASSDLALPGAT